MSSRLSTSLLIAAAIASSSSAASANIIIAPGTYRLGNHPAGSARPPLYGLRLDELFNTTSYRDVFTFDFDRPGSAMYLDYDGSSIHIYGTAFGGRDMGTRYSYRYSGFWTIDFTYGNVTSVPGDDDLWVAAPANPNAGSITYIANTAVNPSRVALFANAGPIPLHDSAASSAYTFRLGDENDDAGHSGFDGISGWGGLTHHTNGAHLCASGWMFTLNPVPLPTSLLLAVIGFTSGAGAKLLRNRRGLTP